LETHKLIKIMWIKHRNRKVWSVPSLPFFSMYVKYDTYLNAFLTPDRDKYNTLEEAQKAVVQAVVKRLASKKTIFEYTTHAGNTGGGKGYANTQWLFGGHNPISDTYQEYGIAFSKDAPMEEVIAFGAKIQERHRIRLLNLIKS